MIKRHKIKHNIISIFILFFVFPMLIKGEGLIHKKIKYSSDENLSKSISSEFISEAIPIPIVNPEPFIAIGLNAKVKSNKSTLFYIRVSKDNKNWSNWQLVENDNHGEKINSKFLGTLSFFEKEHKFIQFKTNIYSNLKELTFSFISHGKTSKAQVEKNLKQSRLHKNFDGIERPSYVNRKDWGCPQNEHVSTRSLTDVTHLIIHHSAGNTVSNDYAAAVLSYWDFHVNGHGWDDIGYNWLVDPNGVLYKGRAWKNSTQENVRGAHNSGKNGNTAGICFIGHYVSNVPSTIGLDKIAGILAFLSDKYGIDPLGKSNHIGINKINDNITGHGQSGGGTACPGTQIINRMQSIRELTYTKIVDITAAPVVVLTYPNVEVDSAFLSKKVFIEFTHPMNKSSVESAFSITPSIAGTTSWNTDGSIIYFEPSTNFTKQTNYKIEISKTATSKWDVPLTDKIEVSFVTKAEDKLSLVATYPKDGDIDIETDVNIELKFDGPISGSSLSGKIFFLDADSNQVNLSVNQSGYSNGIIKFKSRTPLKGNSTYSVHIKEGISTTDNYSFGLNKTIYFTTKLATSVTDFHIPTEYKLEQNYPNPFNPTTTISYNVPLSKEVGGLLKIITLKIYDVLGKEVSVLVNKVQTPGTYSVSFNANNLSSGIYYYQLQSGNYLETKKMILLR